MYNGIGLQTARGSGTNGHVQRNWAFVRPGKKDNMTYKAEEDIAKLEAALNRQPNQDILDHQRKRKIEVKCAEFEEILEKQGCDQRTIRMQIDSYRMKLVGQDKTGYQKDEFGRITVRETHQVAEAQQEKNAKLREAFGISEYFIEGSSFDPDRKTKEELVKKMTKHDKVQTQQEPEKNEKRKYALIRTPSKEKINEASNKVCEEKKKKKRKHRETSAIPNRKEKKKKSKKKKRERSKKKKSKNGKEKYSDLETDPSDFESVNKQKKTKKEKKMQKKKKKHSLPTPETLLCSSTTINVSSSIIQKEGVTIENNASRNSFHRTSSSIRHAFDEKQNTSLKEDLPIEELKSKSNSYKKLKNEPSRDERIFTKAGNRCADSEQSRNSRLKSFAQSSENSSMPLLYPKVGQNRTESAKMGRLQIPERNNSLTPDRMNETCEAIIYSQVDRQSRSRTRDRKRVYNNKFEFNEKRILSANPIRLPLPSSEGKLTQTPILGEWKYDCYLAPKRLLSNESDKKLTETHVFKSTSPQNEYFQNNQKQNMRKRSSKDKMHVFSSIKNRPHLGRSPSPKRERMNPFRVESEITREIIGRSSISPKTNRHQNSPHYVRKGLRSKALLDSNSRSPNGNHHHSPSNQAKSPLLYRKKKNSNTQKYCSLNEPGSHIMKSSSEWTLHEIKSLKLNNKDANIVSSRNKIIYDCSNFHREPIRRINIPYTESVESNTNEAIYGKESDVALTETAKASSKSPSAYYEPINLSSTCNKLQSAEIQLQSKISKVDVQFLTLKSCSESSDLSYSPEQRDPERYRIILEQAEKECNEKKFAKLPKNNSLLKTASKRMNLREEKNGRTLTKYPQPRVHLYCQNDSDSNISEDSKNNNDDTVNFVETLINQNKGVDSRDIQNDLKMLEALKSGLAAKAREKIKTIEKMANEVSPHNPVLRNKFLNDVMSNTSLNRSVTKNFEQSSNRVSSSISAGLQSEFRRSNENVLLRNSDSSSLVDNSVTITEKSTSHLLEPISLQKPKIIIKPFKINESQSCAQTSASSLTNLVEKNVAKVTDLTTEATLCANVSGKKVSPKRRSRSKRTVSGERSRTESKSSYTSTMSRTSSSYRSRSQSTVSNRSSKSSLSRSSSSATSELHSRTRTHSGTRSPSIPRRRGSPSFLDRRRITSARKRPIPYHRPTPSSFSSDGSSYESRCTSPRSNHSASNSPSSSKV